MIKPVSPIPTTAVMLTLAIVAAPAAGQSLQQRIAAVRDQQEQKQTQQRGARVKMLQSLLYRDLTVDFDRTPARDAFDYLGTTLGINLVVRYADDRVGHGIDPALPIVLSVRDAPAMVVLELVLEQCSSVEQCTWQLRKGFLEVGTKERLSVPAARVLRWYAVDELIFEPPDFDDSLDLRLDHVLPGYGGGYGGYSGGVLGGGGYGGSIRFSTGAGGASPKAQRVQSLISFITDIVEPTAWTRNGGDQASISYRDGMLLINAPGYIQRQVFGHPKVPPPDTVTPREE